MSDQATGQSSYTMGYGEEFTQLLDRRSAQTNAARLLPHLKSGQRLLDFGCGPGTISMGLAKAVEPGEFHGVDMEESQIAIARSAAKAGGHDNATFHVGDVTKLPFEDGYFDVAFCHTVLTHVPDTAAVLREAKRVLKPGGLVFSRELIVSSSFIEPSEEKTRPAWNTFARLLAGNGGHPEIGKELREHFLTAGFADVRASASFESFGTPQDVDFFFQFALDWFHAPAVVAAAIKYGLATREQFDEWRSDLEEWRDTPGCFAALAFGECMGTKP